jgi:hypothetical protein
MVRMILERLPGGAYVELAEDFGKVVRERFQDRAVPVDQLTGALAAVTLAYSQYLPRADELAALGEVLDPLLARIRELQQH